MTTLTASDLRSWQQCRRRFLLERSWRVLRWKPGHLFRSCLREGVFALSNGAEIATVRSTARTRFLSEAARPGLDLLTGDPWTVAQDWAGMLGTVLTALSRLVLLTLSRSSTLSLTDESSWLPQSWSDDSGTLHRWITIDAWDDDALAREAHGWPVIADMVACDAPLMLHVVEIGQQRSGRRHSPWARCYKHPVIAGQCRFQRPDGKGGWRKLSGDHWRPLWYSDQTRPDPEAWCDLMDSDHVTPSLLHHVSIAQPSKVASDRILSEMRQVVSEIDTAIHTGTEPMAVPMARASCDPVGGPCPYQNCCFSDDYTTAGIQSSGLYVLRPKPSASLPLVDALSL